MDKPQLEEQDPREDGAAVVPPITKSVPRMRIAHLMLWTLCTAIFLAASQTIRSLQDEPESFSKLMDVSGVVYGIMVGAVMMGAAVLAASRIKQGPPLCLQPGHWLVVVQAIAYLLILPAWAFSAWSASYGGEFSFMLYGLINLCETCIYVPALLNSKTKRWKYFFALLALLLLGQGLTQIGLSADLLDYTLWAAFLAFMTSGGLIMCIFLLVIVLRDKREQLSRDWIHWTGIYSFWVSHFLSLVWTIGARLI